MTKNRAIETRTNEMRNDYHMFYVSPLDVPLEVYEPEKYVYHRARLTIKGEEDRRVETLLRKGWELVPRLKESPIDLDPLNRNPNTKKYYITGGTILMRMEKPVYEYQQKHTFKCNEDKINKIKIATNDQASAIKSSGLTSF